MEQIHGQVIMRTCAKGTLLGLTRTGGLIMGAVLASILLVDLPIPSREPEPPSYVPASETWIEPGAEIDQQAPGRSR